MLIELVMPSNYLILCCPFLLQSSIFPSIWVFSNESALRIRWPKYWNFSFSCPSNEYLALIFFRIDWFDLLAVQETLKSPLQHHNSKASFLWHTTFMDLYGPILHPYMTTGKTVTLTVQTFVGKVMSLLFNMLSRFVIAFLPKNKSLLISLLSEMILAAKKINCHCFHFFPIYFPWVMGLDVIMILAFWMLSFKPVFQLSTFTTSRGSLVPLHFLPLKWYHPHIWACWYFFQQSWFQLVSHPAQDFAWCTLHRGLQS